MIFALLRAFSDFTGFDMCNAGLLIKHLIKLRSTDKPNKRKCYCMATVKG